MVGKPTSPCTFCYHNILSTGHWGMTSHCRRMFHAWLSHSLEQPLSERFVYMLTKKARLPLPGSSEQPSRIHSPFARRSKSCHFSTELIVNSLHKQSQASQATYCNSSKQPPPLIVKYQLSLTMDASTMTAHRSQPRLKFLLKSLPRLAIEHEHPVLKEFTLFPRLPIELRNNIWELVCFQPRVVRLLPEHSPFLSATEHKVKGQTPAPMILQICQESRREGLRHYTQCHTYILLF